MRTQTRPRRGRPARYTAKSPMRSCSWQPGPAPAAQQLQPPGLAAGSSFHEVMDRPGDPTTVAAARYQHAMADWDAAIAGELNRLIDSGHLERRGRPQRCGVGYVTFR